MSRARSVRPRRLQRWLGTATTAVLIVAAGFALGIVAGLVTEGGGLVLDYAAGRTDPLFEEGAPIGERFEDEPSGPRQPAPAPALLAGYSVQVGAFAERGAAERLAGELRAAGLPCYVTPPKAGEPSRFRVRVGPLESREDAEGVAGELKKERGLPTWILEEGAS